MKGACEFFFDFLVREPEHGWLVAVPSYSPENSPIIDGVRSKASLVAGATIDNQMMYELFHSTAEASEILENQDWPVRPTAVNHQFVPVSSRSETA